MNPESQENKDMVFESEKFLFVYHESGAPEEGKVYFLGYVENDILKPNELKNPNMKELARDAHRCGINEIPFCYPIETGYAINNHNQGKYIRTATGDEIEKFNKHLRAER
jgi:hypothetical protein